MKNYGTRTSNIVNGAGVGTFCGRPRKNRTVPVLASITDDFFEEVVEFLKGSNFPMRSIEITRRMDAFTEYNNHGLVDRLDAHQNVASKRGVIGRGLLYYWVPCLEEE